MYWLTTVDNESTTNVRLITKGRSFSSENTSVIKTQLIAIMMLGKETKVQQ